MTVEIKNLVENCSTCRTYSTSQAKEKLQQHSIPNRPWSKVGSDLFSFNGENFLIMVDYLSNFSEIVKIKDIKSTDVVEGLKENFARYGIPDILVTDNGPQYASDLFK